MKWLISILTWLSADPAALDREAPRAAAAVEVAYASMSRVEKMEKKDASSASAGGVPCPDGTCPPQRRPNAKTQ
jgi:hypothetical protein